MKQRIIACLLAVCLLLAQAAAWAEATPILKKGDSGDAVLTLEKRLFELGFLSREPGDTYDDDTEAAVLWFQRQNNLLETGMADHVTWDALFAPNVLRAQDEPENVYVEEVYDAYMPMTTGLPAVPATREPEAGGAWDEDWFNTDEYTHFDSSGFISVASSPLSTFAADVDTSSYAQFRRRVLEGQPVPPDSVRVEEMINYFHYDYAQPEGDAPFGVTVSCAPCPWNEKTRLLQVGLQAAAVPEEERPPYNLVFLIDTSGSMEGEDRLDLVKRAFLLLLETLTERDTVSIVTYASSDKVVLEGVPASEKTTIMAAISELEAGGYTNGSAGLLRAYDVIDRVRKEGDVTRILLATDGDLNVGLTSEGDLARLVTEKKQSGVSLTCLGFGMGNYKDNKMEALADYGDGNCWYIDTIYEARRALVTEAGGTFNTVAKDVKLQLDFNPAYVRGYRLIGYEDRILAAEDFANDAVDGGEVGSGHRVTALYEIVPADSDFDFGEVTSRYAAAAPAADASGDMLTVAVRAKDPDGDVSRLYETPVPATLLEGEALDDNMKFAAAVAETAMLLRDSEWKGTASWAQALELVRSCAAVIGDPYKEEFLYLLTLLER
ncbi:MAG: von Willebrand factor type A domain-containing protein [Clostridia bacterium]|nr:von Willebrand factor type A domain-containing protein [Clostridia bacterium]